MEDSHDKRVKVKYPHSVFFKADGHETCIISEGFGVKGTFSSRIYLLPMVGRDEYEIWMKKATFVLSGSLCKLPEI